MRRHNGEVGEEDFMADFEDSIRCNRSLCQPLSNSTSKIKVIDPDEAVSCCLELVAWIAQFLRPEPLLGSKE